MSVSTLKMYDKYRRARAKVKKKVLKKAKKIPGGELTLSAGVFGLNNVSSHQQCEICSQYATLKTTYVRTWMQVILDRITIRDLR